MSETPPEFKSGNGSFRKALNTVVSYARRHGIHPGGRPGWSATPNGWLPPVLSPQALAVTTKWALNVEDFETGEVSIDCGSIIADLSDVTDTITITSGTSTFTVADGDKIFLKFTNLATPVVTLTKSSTWTDYPSAVEITNSGSSATYAATYYPLYYFNTTATGSYATVKDGVYAHRVAQNEDFRLVNLFYQTGSDQGVVILYPVPGHGPMPA